MISATLVEKNSQPWWKYGYVWLVISGPAIVVVAAFYTLWLAIASPNIVLTDEYYRKGVQVNKNLENPQKSFAPALSGRNHAATPSVDQLRN
ncbi:FixH family protein [Simplicispira psychrophila]|uniref:FixH family protein n=1 Tax=Simplicispira psychrophila TaxID=80882 RepID=UPI000A044A23|nr:FixH family protein [Simplicispira psychrophila]